MTANTYTLLDRSNEKTTHAVNSVALTSANFDAQNTLQLAYEASMQAITLGNLDRQSTATVINFPVTVPTNNFAQRELKLLIRYQGDTTSDVFKLEIGTPDLSSLVMLPESDFVKLDDTSIMAAWVTDFEALAVSPDDLTETVTVLSAQVVGRNI